MHVMKLHKSLTFDANSLKIFFKCRSAKQTKQSNHKPNNTFLGAIIASKLLKYISLSRVAAM